MKVDEDDLAMAEAVVSGLATPAVNVDGQQLSAMQVGDILSRIKAQHDNSADTLEFEAGRYSGQKCCGLSMIQASVFPRARQGFKRKTIPTNVFYVCSNCGDLRKK